MRSASIASRSSATAPAAAIAQLLAAERPGVEALVLIDTAAAGAAAVDDGDAPASVAGVAAAIRARLRADMHDRDLPEADVHAYLAPWTGAGVGRGVRAVEAMRSTPAASRASRRR